MIKTKNNKRNISLLNGKRKYKKQNEETKDVYCDRIKENISTEKNDIIKEMHRFVKDLYLKYPFLENNVNKSIIEDIMIKLNSEQLKCPYSDCTKHLYDFIDKLLETFPYLKEHRNKIIKIYTNHISFSPKENNDLEKQIVVTHQEPIYDKININNKIYYRNQFGVLYDENNIYMGIEYNGKYYLFLDFINNIIDKFN